MLNGNFFILIILRPYFFFVYSFLFHFICYLFNFLFAFFFLFLDFFRIHSGHNRSWRQKKKNRTNCLWWTGNEKRGQERCKRKKEIIFFVVCVLYLNFCNYIKGINEKTDFFFYLFGQCKLLKKWRVKLWNYPPCNSANFDVLLIPPAVLAYPLCTVRTFKPTARSYPRSTVPQQSSVSNLAELQGG